MSRRTNWSLLLCVVLFMMAAADATITSGNSLVNADWIVSPSGLTNLAYCPGGSPSGGNSYPYTSCGYKYPASGVNYLTDTYNSFNGWHNYNPSTNTNLTNYLNGLGVNSSWNHTSSTFGQHFTFTLSDSGSTPSSTALQTGNCYDARNCPNGNFSNNIWWRQPTGYQNCPNSSSCTTQNGYFLSAGKANTTESITITFPTNYYVKDLYFYWGSVDPWNSITFNDTRTGSSHTTTFYGSDFNCANNPGLSSCIPMPFNPSNGVYTPNTTDAVFHFSAVEQTCDSSGNCWIYPWTSVTFTSTQPAFEFDNLQFQYASCMDYKPYNPSNTSGKCFVACPTGPCATAPIQGSPAPVPEAPNLALLGAGITSVAAMCRRKLRFWWG